MEIGCEAVKPPHWVGIAIGSNGYVVRAVAHVDPRHIPMHHFQARIIGIQPSGQLLALFAIHFPLA